MKFFEKKGNSLLFRENGESVLITPWGKNSLRVRAKLMGEIEENDYLPSGSCAVPEDLAFITPTDTGALLPLSERTEAVITVGDWEASIENGNIRASLRVQPWGNALQITFSDHRGRTLLQEIPNGGALQKKARQFKPLPGGNYSLKASFIPQPGEKIYGMGQYQQEILDLKGCNLELAHRNSQASVPFYISSIGYGFLWNNAAVGEVHFGMNTTEWTALSTDRLDYWITAGDTPAQIEEAYAAATGTAPMMPEYGLGFWQCKLRYYNQEQVLSVAREYKKRGIPLDVLVIDYYHWPRCGDWRFHEEFFPDPAAMVKELHDMGIETMVSIWPQVDYRSENYEEMKQQGLLVKSNIGVDIQMLYLGNNVFMDPTNPRTREFVWEKIRKNYGDLGIRTFWLDEAEPEYTTYEFENYRYHAGPVAEVGNLYPREYARLFYEGQRRNGQTDIVNLIRCAWAGSQRYGTLVWSGDIYSTYEDFRRQICAGIHMGLAGIPWWTTDIGGFHGGVIADEGFRELLVRWFQFGTFCPVMRLHGNRQPGQDIFDKYGEKREGTGADNEVWSFGDKVYPILLKFIRVRELMRDYTRSLMQEAHEKGSPVIRALFYEFPDDPACWDIRDAYLFGPDILAAPVCYEGARGRSVYLPAGASWTHAGTGEVYAGGQAYEIDAPLATLPVFLRDGRQEWLIGQI